MPYDVKLPDIGEGIAEGEIVRWHVKVGDTVREDQPLVEVMTDKASVEIPSPRNGTISALLAEEGQMVPVGDVIVSIAVAGEAEAPAPVAAAAAHATAAAAATSAPPAPATAPAAGARVQAVPAVRQLAKQRGVDLETVTGSGPGGRITAEDVERAAAGGAAAKPAEGGGGRWASPDDARQPLRGLRRRIAEQMRRSLSIAAPFTFVAECDFTALAAHRASNKDAAARAGIKLTYLAYLCRAVIEPLRRFPLLNASLDDERSEIVQHRRIHLGIATATDEGLTVPVLHDADRLGLFAAAREIARLADGARTHALDGEEHRGGTFTITTTGARGGVLATPILHHPQVAILGVHEVKPKPAVVDGQIVIRDLGNLSLTLDHRVVDGTVGADFLYALIERLERPDSWLTAEDLT